MDNPDGTYLQNKFLYPDDGLNNTDQGAGQMVRKVDGKWAMHRPNQCRTCCCTFAGTHFCPGRTVSGVHGDITLENVPAHALLTLDGINISTSCYNVESPPGTSYFFNGSYFITSDIHSLKADPVSGSVPNGTYCLQWVGDGFGADNDYVYSGYYARTECLNILFYDDTSCGTPHVQVDNTLEFGNWMDLFIDYRVLQTGSTTYDWTSAQWRVRVLQKLILDPIGYAGLIKTDWQDAVDEYRPCLINPPTISNIATLGELYTEGGGNYTTSPYKVVSLASGGTADVELCGCSVPSDGERTEEGGYVGCSPPPPPP